VSLSIGLKIGRTSRGIPTLWNGGDPDIVELAWMRGTYSSHSRRSTREKLARKSKTIQVSSSVDRYIPCCPQKMV
jgi:hypothetical protein